MTRPRHIAVFDIGKTNAKLALVDRESLSEIEVVTRPNRTLPAPPWPHFDTEGHWEFLLSALAGLQRRHGIDAIAVTTHGACAALLTKSGALAAPVLDYEHDGPEEMRAAYARLRPPFAETGSPHLPLGLNLGAQLHWQLARMPDLRARIDSIVTWPQYWSFRLTGECSCDVTSLGCHTDLWRPEAGGFSSLPATLGLEGKIARPCPPDRVLGRILPEIATATGLPPETQVVSGIHDSNASLLPYLKRFESPFAVVSTGTWVIAMAIGGRRVTLDPLRDTVMNVNALGQSVPSARFMGGRIYESLRPASPAPIGAGEAAAVAARGLMLLPTQDPLRPRWNRPEAELSDPERQIALSFHLALVTADRLALIGAEGPIVIEGPFAQNPCFAAMLGAATGRPIYRSLSQTGTSAGAALLFDGPPPSQPLERAQDMPEAPLIAYVQRWQAMAASPAETKIRPA